MHVHWRLRLQIFLHTVLLLSYSTVHSLLCHCNTDSVKGSWCSDEYVCEIEDEMYLEIGRVSETACAAVLHPTKGTYYACALLPRNVRAADVRQGSVCQTKSIKGAELSMCYCVTDMCNVNLLDDKLMQSMPDANKTRDKMIQERPPPPLLPDSTWPTSAPSVRVPTPPVHFPSPSVRMKTPSVRVKTPSVRVKPSLPSKSTSSRRPSVNIKDDNIRSTPMPPVLRIITTHDKPSPMPDKDAMLNDSERADMQKDVEATIELKNVKMDNNEKKSSSSNQQSLRSAAGTSKQPFYRLGSIFVQPFYRLGSIFVICVHFLSVAYQF